MIPPRRALACLALACPIGPVLAQTTPPRPIRLAPTSASGRTITPELQAALDAARQGNVAPVATAATTAPPAADAGEALKRIQRVQFDRRPSTVLKAWSSPEPEPFQENAPPDATPAPVPPAPTLPPDAPPEAVAAAAAAAAKAAEAAKEKARADRRLAYDLALLERDVTLGRWDRVRAYLMTLPEGDRRPAYAAILVNLANPAFANQAANQRIPPQLRESNSFDFADVLGLAAAAPAVPAKPPVEGAPPPKEPPPVDADRDLQREHLGMLAPILRRALDSGLALEQWVAVLQTQAGLQPPQQVFTPRLSALLLAAIGQDTELAPFLPELDAAVAADDREALNLISRHALALHAKERLPAHLERAWRATQAVLAQGEVRDADKAEALRRAVDLAPQIRAELGDAWLRESFAARPDRGMEVLATIGTYAAQGMQQQAGDTKFRAKTLELQKTAVDALLAAAPERAQAWRDVLNLLASNWIVEAAWAYDNSAAESMTPYMQRDAYGNIYYQSFNQRQNLPVQPLTPADLLPQRPTGAWADMLDAARRPHFLAVLAQLHLKVSAEDEAFPLIEALAATHPARARTLAEEFLRLWTRNHNPNAANARTNQYMFMYGFEQRANAIPLTRSKQERNLEELAALAARLRALAIGDLDEKLLVDAFTQCHSTAEVYQLAAVEKVFGGMDSLSAKTIAGLAERMRSNLVSVWRRPAVQERAKTNRTQKDIEREVLTGYATALAVVEKALQQHAGHWSLLMTRAALEHDANNFAQEVEKSSEFAGRRQRALAGLAAAAARYAEVAKDLRADEWTTQAYDTWFYAALGACDLGAVSDENGLAASQPPLLKAALEGLPGDLGAKHREMFANNLFTRLSSVRPTVKYRYLKAGFDIVGDHPRAAEARSVFQYYNDLVSEVKLVATVDGDVQVGAGKPFGVRVDLVHTVNVERESGGFGKYLQNQNNVRFAYNYGRPTENYRDKFQESVTTALAEHFEVRSVTFNSEEVRSKATEPFGWRVTPYAYLLLEARGPQVDMLPSLHIDLDFLDTSGYAVLPVASAAVPIDARGQTGVRPYDALEITQILDERRAGDGKLVLEVKATAQGLVPPFDQILDLRAEGFQVLKNEDTGVSVVEFAADQEHVRSERTWMVMLAAADGAPPPTRFTFAAARQPESKLVFQRYEDADLATVGPTVELEQRYGERGFPWALLLLGVAVLGFAWFGWRRFGRRERATVAERWRVPDDATPFAVLGLLREIQAQDGLDPAAHGELAAAITRIERAYFAPTPGDSVDLRDVAAEWVRRAR